MLPDCSAPCRGRDNERPQQGVWRVNFSANRADHLTAFVAGNKKVREMRREVFVG